jgi:hypothetical protein
VGIAHAGREDVVVYAEYRLASCRQVPGQFIVRRPPGECARQPVAFKCDQIDKLVAQTLGSPTEPEDSSSRDLAQNLTQHGPGHIVEPSG